MRGAILPRCVAAGLVVLLGSRTPSFAAQDPKPDAAVEALLLKLERPPLRESVQRILSMGAVRSDRTTALRVAGVLWHAGGHASAGGLLTLAKQQDPQVKATAIHGLAAVGLRTKTGFAVVREAMGERDRAIREAAFEAIGRVGDGDDVPSLLDAAESEEVSTRHAAFRALSDLTGQRILADASRWSAWWAEAQETLPARIEAAVVTIETPDAPTPRDDARVTLARYGWMAVPLLTDVAREWLRSADARLRKEGFLLARSLRSGDLAEEVSSTFRYERHPDVWSAGRDAALALGVPTAGIKAPTAYVPDQKNDH